MGFFKSVRKGLRVLDEVDRRLDELKAKLDEILALIQSLKP